jgi:methyltransferase (TIGR00027 family)
MSATPEFGSHRSDDDQWDIESSVGYTALLAAEWRALYAISPQPLARDEYAKLFIAASRNSFLADMLANPGTTDDETAFPRLNGVQTRFFDDFFVSAANAGVRQAVIVAAGLDSRAYRLNWPDGTTVFEIDLPKVMEFKAGVLGQHGAVPRARRIEVAADLRASWPSALEAAGFDPKSPSAWTLEGLLPYLPSDAQKTLFTRISELGAPGSRIAIGAMGTYLDGDRLTALEEDHPGCYLAGNADLTAISYAPETDPGELLAAQGWVVEPVRNTLQLRAAYGMTAPDVDVRIDDVMHSQYITATR